MILGAVAGFFHHYHILDRHSEAYRTTDLVRPSNAGNVRFATDERSESEVMPDGKLEPWATQDPP